MGKLTVKDIENRLLRRIFDKTGNQSLQAPDLEAAMVAILNDYEMRSHRQLSVYQSIEANTKYPAINRELEKANRMGDNYGQGPSSVKDI